jgi:DNA-binding HxlR family transcriptional regulator
MSNNEWWSLPKSRNVGYFTDLSLYSEAMKIISERGKVTTSYLRQELGQRTRGLKLIRKQSSRAVNDLARELEEFGWLQRENKLSKAQGALYTLTEDGEEVLRLDTRIFNHRLAVRMQELFTIPGWFVDRLWKINPEGQGEVILPSPSKNWRPEPRPWEQKSWNRELERQALKSSRMANSVSPGSFPIEEEIWVEVVRSAWDHLGTWKRKSDRIRTFSTRRRLSLAMRRAAVELLFSSQPPGQSEPNIQTRSDKPPLYPRTFRIWCPRLADLEMVFYADKHPDVVGRLVFPTAVFRNDAPRPPFQKLAGIEDPKHHSLWLYQPQWEEQSEIFMKTLIETHRLISRRVGTLYVSLLDVRDEVCRRLRLSFRLFDKFLSSAFRMSIRSESSQSISIESDIREDQLSGPGLVRRPVWIEEVPYSLIAIGKANV